MTPTTQVGVERVLAPSVYDAIVAKADELGGVGSGQLRMDDTGAPLCLYGIARDLGLCGSPYEMATAEKGEWFGLTIEVDDAVWAVRRDLAVGNNHNETRVPIRDVFAKLGIVRGSE